MGVWNPRSRAGGVLERCQIEPACGWAVGVGGAWCYG